MLIEGKELTTILLPKVMTTQSEMPFHSKALTVQTPESYQGLENIPNYFLQGSDIPPPLAGCM